MTRFGVEELYCLELTFKTFPRLRKYKSEKGEQNMKESRYTREQVAEGSRFYSILESVPPEKRKTVELMAEAFINGMQAAQELCIVRESA